MVDFFLVIILIIHLYLVAPDLCCCVWAFSSCSEQGLLLIGVGGSSLQWLLLLWATGSRHVGFSSYTSQALEPRLNGGGARASLPLITWNLPRPGVEPVSPAFTGRFFSAVSPGKFQEMVNFKAIEHPQGNLHVSVCSSVTHNSKNVEGT